MSMYDYKMSISISKEDYPFYSLIMAAMRQADDENLYWLQYCWPGVWNEFEARYNSPGGILQGDDESGNSLE